MKKVLWASPNSLLDTSSGFALAIREILFQLKKFGYDIEILSATIFDSPNALHNLGTIAEQMKLNIGKFTYINDDDFIYTTLITKSTNRQDMRSMEDMLFLNKYKEILHSFKPDVVFYARDGLLEFEIGYLAKQLKIKTVSYIANPSYKGKRWIKDIDLLVCDSIATSKMYKEKEGYDITPIGLFISKERYLAGEHIRKHILFINPVLEKGVLIVMQLAIILEKKRPDIVFEIVESRGEWTSLLQNVTKHFGEKRDSLSNVVITENTNNMKQVYSRARVLLVPSLWFESAGRVIAEAQLNGIPVIGTGRGGSGEMIGDGGIIFPFPEEFYKQPYNKSLPKEKAQELVKLLERFYDDRKYYNEYVSKALDNYNTEHNIDKNTQRLINTIENT